MWTAGTNQRLWLRRRKGKPLVFCCLVLEERGGGCQILQFGNLCHTASQNQIPCENPIYATNNTFTIGLG
jgi:hypothetical protein